MPLGLGGHGTLLSGKGAQEPGPAQLNLPLFPARTTQPCLCSVAEGQVRMTLPISDLAGPQFEVNFLFTSDSNRPD
jgi:hypothetical protein